MDKEGFDQRPAEYKGRDRMSCVYHYCSVDTFLKIIQSNIIRLSDIGKSNDYGERIYIENWIHEELIREVEETLPPEVFKNFLQVEKLCRDKCHQNIVLYAICFSEENDLLSQWRGDANNGMGVAIGFSTDVLKALNKERYGLTFKPVCYEQKTQERFVRKQVQTIINTMKIKNAYAAFAEVYENEIANLGCIKAPGFSEEKEWRLCIAMTPEVRVNCEAKFLDFTLSRVREQCIRERIITYFDLSFEKVRDDLIKEIIIGPNARITPKDIYRSLYINGYQTDQIKVSISDITYRQ